MQSVPPRARAAAVAVLAAAITLTVIGPAAAHEDPGAQHAAEDLAGTPMTLIEREAAVTADQIARATGVRPGQRSPEQQRLAAAEAAAADPAGGGAWSGVYGTPVVPVFTAMLPNGKVLMWDSVGDG
ncbi:MAG TPA: hypothetical protein VGJ44_04370, partial [Kribbellaceae bacterium]